MDTINKIDAVLTNTTPHKKNPKQSANTLFHSKKDFDRFFEILKNKCFTPRYYIENVEYLNASFKYLAVPMVCFCDIVLGKLNEHMKIYGKYVIGLKKGWGEKQKLQKILYLNADSILCANIKNRFLEALINKDVSEAEKNLLMDILKFTKPIWGFQNGKNIYYPDDSEWRYVPTFKNNDLPPLFPLQNNSKENVRNFNDSIANSSLYNIYFDDDDIKYIILPNKSKLKKLINFLKNSKRENLISKILIWNNIKEDL